MQRFSYNVVQVNVKWKSKEILCLFSHSSDSIIQKVFQTNQQVTDISRILTNSTAMSSLLEC